MWKHQTLDSRGSLNLPASLKHLFQLDPGGTSLALRQVGGVILVVPLVGKAKDLYGQPEFDEWVKQEAGLPTVGYVPAALPVSSPASPDVKPGKLTAVEARLEIARLRAEEIALKAEAKLRQEKLRQDAANARHAQRMEMKNRELIARCEARRVREGRLTAKVQPAPAPEQPATTEPAPGFNPIQAMMDAASAREEAERKAQMEKDLRSAVEEMGGGLPQV